MWKYFLLSFVFYWYRISRFWGEYFRGLYFRAFNRQIWKKGIKFRDLIVVNFILFLKLSELFTIFRFTGIKKVWNLFKLTLFHIQPKIEKEPTSKTSQQFVSPFVDTLVYVVAMLIFLIFFCNLNFLYGY